MSGQDRAYLRVGYVVLVILLGVAVYSAFALRDVQRQLDHIDTHFQAPAPTPQQNGVTG